MAFRLRLATAAAIVALIVSHAKADPAYDIQLIGLYGAAYTAPNGTQFSSVSEISPSGRVLGSSRMYDANSESLGSAIWMFDGNSTVPISPLGPEFFDDGFYSIANLRMTESGKVEGVVTKGNDYIGWVYDGSATHIVGLLDGVHVSTDGRHSAFIEGLNEAGQATGYSDHFTPSGGASAWFFNGSTSVQIGLTGAGFTHSGGHTYNRPSNVNASGKVVGQSYRYTGSTYYGQSAWYYDGTTTVEIGLVDAEHTVGLQRNNGAIEVNDGGFVAGSAHRYVGGVQRGQSAWRFDGTTTARLGFTDAVHTSSNQSKFSQAYGLNNAGQMVGSSTQYYSGSSGVGQTAWIYDGNTTTTIGLTGSEYTQSSGATYNSPWEINQAGHVVGSARRYSSGGADRGESIWTYRNSTTTKIGLEDAEHTRDDDYRFNQYRTINAAGVIAGFADRYLGGNTQLGSSAWIYNGTTTVEVGLSGSAYTRDDNYEFTSGPFLNEAGQAYGRQDRYLGGNTRLGREAWFYDPTLNQTIPLTLSMRSDGFADSTVNFLSDEGVAVGRYTLFDANDANLGDRVFYFSLEDGLHDLGALVEGGLSAEGWERLTTTAGVSEAGQIVGRGLRGPNLNNTYAYFMTPIEVEEDADFNDSGVVDAGDYVTWRKGLGTAYNQDHYALWRSQFGTVIGGSASGADAGVLAAAVPEPATWALVAACFAIAPAVRRRRTIVRS